MNIHKAGLYTRATLTTWLIDTGLASPPVLVLLGLTLPDSRILHGVAGIGLTPVNIPDLIPHLRQSTIDSTHANNNTPAPEISTLDHEVLAANVSHPMQVSLSTAMSLVFVTVSPREGEHVCLAGDQPACSVLTEPLDHLDAPSLKLSLRKVKDEQTCTEFKQSPRGDCGEMYIDTSDTSVQGEQVALIIPLPAPDMIEDTLFVSSAALFASNLRGVCSAYAHAQDLAPKISPAGDNDDHTITMESTPRLASGFSRTSLMCEMLQDISPVASVFNVNETVTSTPTKTSIRDPREPKGGITSSDSSPPQSQVLESAHTTRWQELKSETPQQRRPESLLLIPQSVIGRFPSAHRTYVAHRYSLSSFAHDFQAISVPSPSIAQQALLLEEGDMRTTTWTDGVSPQRALAFSTSLPIGRHVEQEGRGPCGGTIDRRPELVIKPAALQGSLQKEPALLSQPPQEPTAEVHTQQLKSSLRQYRVHSRRRLSVLARAALRNRRYNNVDSDDSSSSESDSESDSESQCSGSSSGEENILPRMLGSKLIAAIDANSEWERNLYGPRKTAVLLPDVHETFPESEDSRADVSLIMHGPSTIDASDTDVRLPAGTHSLTYEDIQNWATGVVHTCVKRVYRSHASVPPRSPSQVSDVCAERPLIPGISRCPLAGHHCKLGASGAAEPPALEIAELPASEHPLPATQPTRKPLVA